MFWNIVTLVPNMIVHLNESRKFEAGDCGWFSLKFRQKINTLRLNATYGASKKRSYSSKQYMFVYGYLLYKEQCVSVCLSVCVCSTPTPRA